MNTNPGRTAFPSPLITTEWLQQHLQDPGLRILDCTVVMKTLPDGTYDFSGGRAEWEAGHIPGAVFADVLGELSAKDHPLPMMMPPPEQLAAAMSALGVGEGTHVVLYDRGNHAWATRVWWMLRACGFDDAAVLDGGWKKWTSEGRPVSTERSTYPRAELTPRVRGDAFATRQDVLTALGDTRVSVINALSPQEHSGKAPTRYPRAGRIAGSGNVFCQFLVDPDTHAYLSPPALRKLFEEAGAMNAERVITYCGAGIAASSDAFALHLLGMQVAVYDGSLSEWTADPALPMETDPA